MATQAARALQLLRRRGTARAGDFAAAGITRATLQRLLASGTVERVDRGVYMAADSADIPAEWTLIHVARRVPSAVFCLLTALAFHGIGTQQPAAVWIAVGGKARTPKLRYPRLRVLRFPPEALTAGVGRYSRHGVELHVTTPARTIADCFKYRNKIGLDVAIEALREGWRDRRFEFAELERAARARRVARIMRPYLEALA